MDLTDFIATLALITSVVSLTYTIIVDKRKPRLKVRGDIRVVIERGSDGGRQRGSYFSIHATNHGPERVNVMGVGLTHRSRLKRWFRRVIRKDETQGALLEASPESPHQLPMWLGIGETLTLFYPENSEFLQENELFDCFYLYDSLGGNHWAPKGVFRSARETLERRD